VRQPQSPLRTQAYTRAPVRGRSSRRFPAALQGRTLRRVAWGAVATGIAVPLARRRLRLPAPLTAAAAATAPFSLAVAAPRSRKRDVGVYALQMWAFIVIHELPYDDRRRLEERAHVDYPIAGDRLLGFGVPPTLRLQRAFGRPGRVTLLDHGLVWVHWLWFLEPHGAAAWILLRDPKRFTRSALMICSLFDLGIVVYTLVPTAPPWWAAREGRLPGARRIMVEVGERFWGRLWGGLYDFLGGNPVAAMPSLHFATSVMAAHMLSEVGTVEGTVGWAYAGTLGFALVYLGEHYVVDLLAGLLLAEAVRHAGPRVTPALAEISRAVQSLEARART
jgi:membrane-associated phospholipid phosphatase